MSEGGARGAVVALSALLALATPAAARAGSGEKCAEAAERAQASWKHGRLLDAQAALRECLKPSCPRVVRDDCTTWQPQLDAVMPTVVVAAKNAAGDDLTDVAITIDGRRLEGTTSGLASAVDPGSHVFRFAREGASPVERTVVIREGEKRRLIEARFDEGRKVDREAPASPPSSRPPPLAWILGGAGIAALGGFAVLGLTGLDRYHTLHAECRTTRACTTSEVSSNRTQLWVADGLGVLGVVGVAAAVWLWVDARATRVGLGPGHVIWRGTF